MCMRVCVWDIGHFQAYTVARLLTNLCVEVCDGIWKECQYLRIKKKNLSYVLLKH